MRRVLSFVFVPAAFAFGAAAVACASSNEEASETLAPDAQVTVVLDAGNDDSRVDDADADGSPSGPRCSAAGWCETALPDADLVLKDVWPLAGRAYAIAESTRLGVKVLEWDDALSAWSYIDDGTQNEPGLGAYAGNVWTADGSVVYYAVAPGFIYRGTRPVAPATSWSWTRYRLPDPTADHAPGHDHGRVMHNSASFPALGVKGTNSGTVYAWYASSLFRWSSTGEGAPGWSVAYVADDPDSEDEHLSLLGIASGAGDDLWIAGARGGTFTAWCPILVRLTAEGSARIADGVAGDFGCTERDGHLLLGADAWLGDLHAVAPDGVLGLVGGRDVVRITRAGDTYEVKTTSVSPDVAPDGVDSIWAPHDDEVWVTGSKLVLHGTNVWDGGAFAISSIALGSGPLGRAMYRVRGTSNTNLWAVGVRHALHKTNP